MEFFVNIIQGRNWHELNVTEYFLVCSTNPTFLLSHSARVVPKWIDILVKSLQNGNDESVDKLHK